MALELSHLVNAHPALVWIALADGRAEILNQRWCAYTGLGVNQAMGHGWQGAVHPNDLALVLERWRSCLVSGQPGEVEARTMEALLISVFPEPSPALLPGQE